MDDPVNEIENVVRSITEPSSASEIAKNVDRMFTDDSYIMHPLLNQPKCLHGKKHLKGIYKILRVNTINNKIQFHAVMFSQDKTQVAIELTEHLQVRWMPTGLFLQHLRFIVRIDLRREDDGKYRICRQNDNFISDLATSGALPLPITVAIISQAKLFIGLLCCVIGHFLLENNLLGH